MRILRILVAQMRDIDFSAPLRLVKGLRPLSQWSRLARLPRLPRQLLAGACCVFTFSAAQAACPPSAIASLEKPGTALRNGVDRGMLWRIERDGRTSWLYGTIHVGRGDWVRPGPTIQKALTQSDTLALEIDSRDEATAAAMARPADPEALARVLTGERARRLERQNAEACVPPGALSKLQPILQVTALAGLVARADGLYPEFGVDETLAVSARNSNKPIVALESAAAQLKVLTGESEAEEGEQIDAALDELESGKLRGQLKELADVWARSDAARLARYADWCDCLNTPAEQRLMKRLLDDRNPNLADGIERLHAGGKGVFAAVGALHMIGAQGLPTLMAARGFTVTPVLTDAQAQTAAPMAALAAPSPAPRAVRGGKAVKGQRGQATQRGAKGVPTAKGGKAAPAPKGGKAPAKAAGKAPAKAPAKAAAPAAKGKVRR
ncbi:TraB/GumN family protein [Variovorax sp. J22G73]|uniref:TraB/GumN family protein n=1 Tax=unclassified Variovorax TaxID=663243 RepID=UPI0025765D0B|nr:MULTISPECIES: TraB/GumN family protein [unclassified Variovorax]MDM0010731.1 TraB/GumN family protein [Variovorax sp. J22R203]MDM0103191.1 TraB/GumN family protein [Variovorax sp. J22G73]